MEAIGRNATELELTFFSSRRAVVCPAAKGSQKQEETIGKPQDGSSPHRCREEKKTSDSFHFPISPDCVSSVSWICSERTGAILQRAASISERRQMNVVLISAGSALLLSTRPPPSHRRSWLNTAMPPEQPAHPLVSFHWKQ